MWYRSLTFGDGGGDGRGGGGANPYPASLEDFIFCLLLLGPFSEFVSDPCKASVDELLDVLQFCRLGSPCFSSIQQHRIYCGVEEPDFVGGGQVRPGSTVLHWKEVTLALPSFTY